MRIVYSLTDTTGCLAVWPWTMCMKTLGSFALCLVPIPVRYMSWIKVQLMRVHAGVSSLSSSIFSQLIFWYISNGIGTCTNGCFNWKVCFITNLIMYWFNWVIGFRIWDRFFIYFFFFQLEELALVVLSEFLRTPEQISKVSVLHVFIYYMLI